jgi:spore germination cell wall hydrolase CwlJ-like protein
VYEENAMKKGILLLFILAAALILAVVNNQEVTDPVPTTESVASLSVSEYTTQTVQTTATTTTTTTIPTESLPEATEAILESTEYTSTEFDLMCRIVALEGHPKYGYELYLQVATVIMNRVESEKFPDNVTDVLSQRNQFSTYKTSRKPVYNDDVFKAAEDAYYHGKRNLPNYVLAFITEEAYPKNVAAGGAFKKLEVYKIDNTVAWCYWPEDKED